MRVAIVTGGILFVFLSLSAARPNGLLRVNITPNIEFIEDATRTQSAETVRQLPANSWQTIGKEATNFGFSDSVYWLRFDLGQYPDFANLRSLYVVFEWKALDSLELFPASEKRVIAGDAFPKNQWSLPEAHFPAFRIDPKENAEKIYYVRLESTSIKNFPVFLKSENNYLHELKSEVTLIVIYTTVALILILFAIFMYAISNDTSFLLYAGYLISIALAFDTTFGNAFDIFWPEATWWQNRAGFTLVGVQIVFSMLFVSRLLDFPRHLPKAHFVCNMLAGICLLSLPLSLTNLPVVWFSTLYSFIYLFTIPAFFAVGIYLLPRAGTHVRFFIVGWVIFFFFAVPHILYLRSVLPFSNSYIYAPIFVFPIDIFFFFVSIWEKQRESNRERLRLLDEKIDALSEKVKYRKSSLTEVDTADVLQKLEILMKREKLFLIEDLRLPDLAKALGLNRTQVSELLNSRFGKNFANFINEYRIEEAQRLLLDSPEHNVLEIAFATGFGSKAAFSAEFKRLTGITAKEFRKKNVKKRPK